MKVTVQACTDCETISSSPVMAVLKVPFSLLAESFQCCSADTSGFFLVRHS